MNGMRESQLLPKTEHKLDEMCTLVQTIFSKLLDMEYNITSHINTNEAQGKELIEIRKDQEHLYRYMKTIRTETALLREEIEEMRIIVDEMLKHNKSFIEAVHQPYKFELIKSAKFS